MVNTMVARYVTYTESRPSSAEAGARRGGTTALSSSRDGETAQQNPFRLAPDFGQMGMEASVILPVSLAARPAHPLHWIFGDYADLHVCPRRSRRTRRAQPREQFSSGVKSWHRFVKSAAKARNSATTSRTRITSRAAAGVSTCTSSGLEPVAERARFASAPLVSRAAKPPRRKSSGKVVIAVFPWAIKRVHSLSEGLWGRRSCLSPRNG